MSKCMHLKSRGFGENPGGRNAILRGARMTYPKGGPFVMTTFRQRGEPPAEGLSGLVSPKYKSVLLKCFSGPLAEPNEPAGRVADGVSYRM